MNRVAVLKLLNEHREQVRKRFGAKRLTLFGSAARDELRADSDIDVLVEFEGPTPFDGYTACGWRTCPKNRPSRGSRRCSAMRSRFKRIRS
jgi:tRNA nucleotidyltransferase (CCA-adding enzyme)